MNFAPFRRLLLEICRFGSGNGIRSNLYSSTAMSIPEGSKTELYRRICVVGDPKVSILPILKQWVEEGRSVDEQTLDFIVSELRCLKRPNHALQILIWMNARGNFEPSSQDSAKRLPLVSKAKGMRQAVEVNDTVRDRAMQLSACAATDIDKTDKIVKMVESDPKVVLNWTNYYAAAVDYRKAGLLDKALEMLKQAEACLTSETDIYRCTAILRQYAIIGKKEEVIRFWSFYKKKCKVNNNGYRCIISSLGKLGDFEMAEEILYEWESRDDLTYDMDIPNFIIAAYSKKGLIEKAEALIDRAISKGGKPNTWTWYCLVQSYLKNEQPEKAVEMMKKALVNSKPGWKPNMKVVKACMEYLRGLGDKEPAEEFLELLQVKIPMWMDAKRDFEPGSEDDAKRLPLVSKAKGMQQAVEVNGTVHDKTDKIAKIVESDPKVVLNWTNYSAAAVGYQKAGLFDKALEMLKKAEACLTSETCIYAYSAILRQYATMGKKEEVLRLCSFFKKNCKVNNEGYIIILSSLVKLGDYEIAEEIFYEWDSRDDLTYDMNIPNFIIAAYSTKGLIEKAEALINRAISKGGKPNTWTWHCLVKAYLENHQPEKAVEMMKKAILNSKPGWKPGMALVKSCLNYLKGVGDNEQIEDFANLLQSSYR
ncbi:Tetratricopeptide repeat (TPR)-like superfamily protein [Euphorbia peplus]|nr:Tetratricopeptide repeat (TPR)-like superfamily protein [Euphorbia peplus]